jgi:hypothetical protein
MSLESRCQADPALRDSLAENPELRPIVEQLDAALSSGLWPDMRLTGYPTPHVVCLRSDTFFALLNPGYVNVRRSALPNIQPGVYALMSFLQIMAGTTD